MVHTMMPNDVFVVQKLALATYKSNLPTPVDALNEASQMLEALNPGTSTNSETLGLYGTIKKRLWEATQESSHLDIGIWASAKGFYVSNSCWSGNNLAYLLNVRAALTAESAPAEAIADFILAQRTRRRLLELCQALLESEHPPKGADEYWVKAAMAEAYLGLGDDAKAQELLAAARAISNSVPLLASSPVTMPAPAPSAVQEWMIRTVEDQLAHLRDLLNKSPLDRIK